ncbi:MAG: hypothetical protein JSS32_03395 [Verrucomicrobia bacterium]|nr:hypothetical protein [Verrucomicrobiota bacterium]
MSSVSNKLSPDQRNVVQSQIDDIKRTVGTLRRTDGPNFQVRDLISRKDPEVQRLPNEWKEKVTSLITEKGRAIKLCSDRKILNRTIIDRTQENSPLTKGLFSTYVGLSLLAIRSFVNTPPFILYASSATLAYGVYSIVSSCCSSRPAQQNEPATNISKEERAANFDRILRNSQVGSQFTEERRRAIADNCAKVADNAEFENTLRTLENHAHQLQTDLNNNADELSFLR